ncbi:MAG: hypothetical protein ABW328_22210 [Ilumatobacteraceae bacterium]
MNYQHWTMRDAESRRGVVPTIAIGAVCVVVIAGFTLFFASRSSSPDLSASPALEPSEVAPVVTDGSPDPTDDRATDDSVPDFSIPHIDIDLGGTDGLSTDGLGTDGLTPGGLGTGGLTVNPGAANGQPATTATVPGATPASAPVIAPPVGDAAETSLDELGQSLAAAGVAGPARKFAGTYAVVNLAGVGHLYEWDGTTWTELETIEAPVALRDARSTDVTGDGSPDFVMLLEDGSGGVLNNTGTGWDWMQFLGPDGIQTFVPGLAESSGRISSTVAGATGALDWRWDGFEFVPRT